MIGLNFKNPSFYGPLLENTFVDKNGYIINIYFLKFKAKLKKKIS